MVLWLFSIKDHVWYEQASLLVASSKIKSSFDAHTQWLTHKHFKSSMKYDWNKHRNVTYYYRNSPKHEARVKNPFKIMLLKQTNNEEENSQNYLWHLLYETTTITTTTLTKKRKLSVSSILYIFPIFHSKQEIFHFLSAMLKKGALKIDYVFFFTVIHT